MIPQTSFAPKWLLLAENRPSSASRDALEVMLPVGRRCLKNLQIIIKTSLEQNTGAFSVVAACVVIQNSPIRKTLQRMPESAHFDAHFAPNCASCGVCLLKRTAAAASPPPQRQPDCRGWRAPSHSPPPRASRRFRASGSSRDLAAHPLPSPARPPGTSERSPRPPASSRRGSSRPPGNSPPAGRPVAPGPPGAGWAGAGEWRRARAAAGCGVALGLALAPTFLRSRGEICAAGRSAPRGDLSCENEPLRGILQRG